MGEQEDAEENLLEDDKETGEQRQRRPREKMSPESGRQAKRRTRQRMKKTQESNKQTQRRQRQDAEDETGE